MTSRRSQLYHLRLCSIQRQGLYMLADWKDSAPQHWAASETWLIHWCFPCQKNGLSLNWLDFKMFSLYSTWTRWRFNGLFLAPLFLQISWTQQCVCVLCLSCWQSEPKTPPQQITPRKKNNLYFNVNVLERTNPLIWGASTELLCFLLPKLKS